MSDVSDVSDKALLIHSLLAALLKIGRLLEKMEQDDHGRGNPEDDQKDAQSVKNFIHTFSSPVLCTPGLCGDRNERVLQ